MEEGVLSKKRQAGLNRHIQRVKGTEQGAEMRPQTHSLGLWGLAAQIRITSSGEQESFPVGSDQRLRN